MKKLVFLLILVAFLLPFGASDASAQDGIRSPLSVLDDMNRGISGFEMNRIIRSKHAWERYERALYEGRNAHRPIGPHWTERLRYYEIQRSYYAPRHYSGYGSGYGGSSLHHRYGGLMSSGIQAGTVILLSKMENSTVRRGMDQEYKLENRRLDLEERRMELEYKARLSRVRETNRSARQNRGYLVYNTRNCEVVLTQGKMRVATIAPGDYQEIFVDERNGRLSGESERRCGVPRVEYEGDEIFLR